MYSYDYLENVKADVKNWIHENADYIRENCSDYDEMADFLNDELFVCDSVTGNASGSYTFSAYEAEENICHNLDLLQEAMEEFGYTDCFLEKGAEWADVAIRCYLLSRAISEVLADLKESAA